MKTIYKFACLIFLIPIVTGCDPAYPVSLENNSSTAVEARITSGPSDTHPTDWVTVSPHTTAEIGARFKAENYFVEIKQPAKNRFAPITRESRTGSTYLVKFPSN